MTPHDNPDSVSRDLMVDGSRIAPSVTAPSMNAHAAQTLSPGTETNRPLTWSNYACGQNGNNDEEWND